MKISTTIHTPILAVGEEKTLEYIARAGFDAWDFSMFSMALYDKPNDKMLPNDHPLASKDYLKYARRLKQIGLDNGIVCNQSHAPFPTYVPEIRSVLKRAIECTAEAGGKICVIHPLNYWGVPENTELFMELMPFAKEYGVKVATENLYHWDREKDEASFAACATPENFKAVLDAVDNEYMVACVDVGHAEMKGLGTSAPEMIRYLGDKVQALHLHDTDKWHDNHQIPFSMDIDFSAIVQALKDINYQGDLTLEADTYLTAKSFNADNILEGICDLGKAVSRIRDMF